MEQLLEKVKTYDWGQSRTALTELSELVKKSHGNATEMSKYEKGMLGVLKSDAKRAGKQFICRQLSIIGTERSAPTLALMLTGEETSDMARYALERIPGEAVDDALRKAVPKTKGKIKVGIINSLGQRGDKKSAKALSGLVGSSDKMIAGAAAAALGQIGGSDASKSLAKAKDTAAGKLRNIVLDAYLKCADQMVAGGNKIGALGIYKELQKKDMPTPIRTAALRGIVNATKR